MEISLEELKGLMLNYLDSGRSIPISNTQERQGNSKLWEKDVANFVARQVTNSSVTILILQITATH